ncbi:hypothetical protein BCON_0436g00050 [Botryotinia convoluta]|uniref:Uncharacterized protein n=1 Tax=Botryotinia convoluta TaxID=54673 RepID=A0A4Z1H8G4_9HELO|nr:hypothetical protein BCON_0436g00050 [Botryotinia convoluta]
MEYARYRDVEIAISSTSSEPIALRNGYPRVGGAAAYHHDLAFQANIGPRLLSDEQNPQLSHMAEDEGYMTSPVFDMDEDELEQIESATSELDRLHTIEHRLPEDVFEA